MAQFCSHCVTPGLRELADESESGLFGRMFPDLPPLRLDLKTDLAIGRAGGVMDASAQEAPPHATDNPRIPAGWTFFGQIIAHDVTHDRTPLREHEAVEHVRNYRNPRMDLEVVYGAGPVGQPYLYQRQDDSKLLVGSNDEDEPWDLPRNPEGLAIIGDPRNDTYLFISQLHLALIKLHNVLIDEVRAAGVPSSNVFTTARQLTRWCYQWIILHEYLPLTVGQQMVEDVLVRGPRAYKPDHHPYVPVEFSAAAFRFGHSQVRSHYDVNDTVRAVPIFPDLVGQRPVPASRRPEWYRYFEIPGDPAPQPSKQIDIEYAGALEHLPKQLTGELEQPDHAALAYRDLQRCSALDLPSGEDVASALGEKPLSRDELGMPPGVCRGGTPLCYYVLREAEVESGGKHLGRVGGRMVAEVIIGLLRADPTSYLQAEPDWKPALAGRQVGDFTMADLLAVTGALPHASSGAPANR